MKKALKGTLAIAAGVAVLGGVIAPSQASAWGPVRDIYTYQEINKLMEDGKWPKDKIVFNSISNSPMGDERNFVGAREYNGDDKGAANIWNADDITVKDGQEYKIRIYIHNNNPYNYEGVAENVKAFFNIPSVSAKQVQVNGFVYSSNATPNKIWDYVNFNSDQAFHLEYVYGSAILENASLGKGNGYALSDEVVTKSGGTMIGYDALDGRIPGCYEFTNYVTIRVKAVFDTDYMVDKKVRLEGEKDWKDTVDAKVGDKVEFQIQYKNQSKDSRHTNVVIKDILPKNLRYVPGTTKLFNTNFKDGATVVEDTVATTGINIGNYAANGTGFVRFTAEVVDNSLACGANTLVNWAQAGVGQKTIQDYATVSTTKVCTDNKIPDTGPEALAGGAVAAGSVVTAAGYFVASRRSLRK